MIRVEGLTKSYGAYRALDAVTFGAAPGELLLLLGGNGAGKSTLLRCLMGLLSYQGRVSVAGFDPLRQGREVRRRIGYMPQGVALHLDLTVAETLRFYGELRRVPLERARRLLEEVELGAKLGDVVGELSGGMRQRLHFALALLDDPPVLLLDEPTASLDEWSRDFLTTRVRRLADQGKTVVLSTHARELLPLADRTLVLERGRVERFEPLDREAALPRSMREAGADAHDAGGSLP